MNIPSQLSQNQACVSTEPPFHKKKTEPLQQFSDVFNFDKYITTALKSVIFVTKPFTETLGLFT